MRWIGRQTVTPFFAGELSLPVRIRTGALGENAPSRDLLVSHDHALLVDGVLVQAGALINGTSIVRESDVPGTFVYYHVEVDDHSLILAENVPAETFVDNVDRARFDNWHEYEALYPAGKNIAEMPYPRAKAHRQVPAWHSCQAERQSGPAWRGSRRGRGLIGLVRHHDRTKAAARKKAGARYFFDRSARGSQSGGTLRLACYHLPAQQCVKNIVRQLLRRPTDREQVHFGIFGWLVGCVDAREIL